MSAAQHVCERLKERLPYRHMILMNHMKDWRTHEQDAALQWQSSDIQEKTLQNQHLPPVCLRPDDGFDHLAISEWAKQMLISTYADW